MISIHNPYIGWISLTTTTMTAIVQNCPHMRYLDLGNCNGLDDQAAQVIGQLGMFGLKVE